VGEEPSDNGDDDSSEAEEAAAAVVDPVAKRKAAEEEARQNLYKIMGAMRDVRVRDERTQKMFAPLKETVRLLDQYGAQPLTLIVLFVHRNTVLTRWWRPLAGSHYCRLRVKLAYGYIMTSEHLVVHRSVVD
jgi:hypothetical protein